MKKSFVGFLTSIIAVMVALIFVVSVSGCKKEESTMEQVNKIKDQSVEATKDALPEAGKTVKVDPEKEKTAIVTAEKWLVLVDKGKDLESWQEADEFFKNSIQQEQWRNVLELRQKNFGKVISRKLITTTYKTYLPIGSYGQYFEIKYETSFQKKKSVIETVLPKFDKDGWCRVSGYHLK